MKTFKTETIELTRHNVTPSAFLAYIRATIKKYNFAGIYPGDIDYEYFKGGYDLNFDINHKKLNDEVYKNGVEREISVSHPYQQQTYILNVDSSMYNLIIEFTFDDEKTGTGYFYYLNVCEE